MKLILQEIYSAMAFGLIIGVAVLSNYLLHRLNVTPLRASDVETHNGSFIAELADNNLKVFESFANEELALNYIFDKIHVIKNASERKADIEIDRPVVSGEVFGFLIYKNLQNIVVRVQGDTNHTLLLYCHFDSVTRNPGASDGIVMCSVMMELLRVISQQEKRERHSIVFLFIGSEKESLQASHGFGKQHRWAENVKAYINLESSGRGGREIVFRRGTWHDTMIRSLDVPRLFGHGFSGNFFESGRIPAGTDFDILRHYSGEPWFGFSYVDDGLGYHTRYHESITLESIQRTGDNMLGLLKKIVNSDDLEKPLKGSLVVHFEYFGLFFISYTKEVGVRLNISISLLAVIIPFILQTKFKLSNVCFVFCGTLISLASFVVSSALSAVVCILMATIMNSADNAMSWNSFTFLSIGIYGSLAVLVQISVYHLIDLCTNCFFKHRHDTEKVQIQLNGVTLFWCIWTLVVTEMGDTTMVVTFFALCTSVLTHLLCFFLPKIKTQAWILGHLFGHSFLLLWTCFLMFQIWELFLPISAKYNYENPDVLIAFICAVWTVICFSYFVPLTKLVKFRAFLYSFISLTFLVSLILSFTSVGFPYNDDKTSPRLQRFEVFHIRRTFYDNQVDPIFNETGFLISTIDPNAERTLNSIMKPKNLIDWADDSKCTEVTYCGFPIEKYYRGKYLKASTQDLAVEPTELNVIRAFRERFGNKIWSEIEFTLKLRTATTIIITPGPGWSYNWSSMPMRFTEWRNGTEVYAKITNGKHTDELMQGTVRFKGTTFSDPLNVATFTIATKESVFEKSAEFQEVMDKFPDYTFTEQRQVDVSSYIVKLTDADYVEI